MADSARLAFGRALAAARLLALSLRAVAAARRGQGTEGERAHALVAASGTGWCLRDCCTAARALSRSACVFGNTFERPT
jgi:hypothetical protein